MDAPLHRPTARAHRALNWAQMLCGGLVLVGAIAVGSAVQERPETRTVTSPAAEVVAPTARDAGSLGQVVVSSPADGTLAAVGTLIVGWTVTASVGTLARRRLTDRESARWAADWERIEPVWSGRVG